MKLEIGKKYITRDWRQVEIVAIRPELEGNQIAGILDNELNTWHINGNYMKEYVNNLDLIDEVKEPHKQFFWVNIYLHVIEGFLTEQDAKSKQWSSCLACKKITIEYTEGEGLE
jgi:hypothetical protein